MIPQVQIPDFAGTLMRGQQLQQQGEMSRLQMLAQQQALNDADAFRTALGEVGPQLATAEGPARLSLLSRLAGAGPQGANLALPMIGQERERAEGQRLIQGLFGGVPPVAPAMPAAPSAPARPVDGPTDPRARVQEAARRRQAILDNPNLSPQQQAAALAEVSAWLAAPSVPERPGGYAANPGSPEAGRPFAGLPAPSGVVPAVLPGGAAPRTATPASAAPAPSGAPAAAPGAGASSLPRPEQLMALMMSGNPTAMRFAQSVAPLVARDNPNWTSVTADGQVFMVNPQNPSQRVLIGAATDAPVERIRQPDGSTRIVRRADAVGQTEAAAQPDNFGRANTLRDEFTRLTGDFRTVQTAWENMQANARSTNGQGDMAMLYQFIKLLDPTSVVRESEFAMAAQTGAIDERVAGWVQRIMSGERLPDSVRQAFLAEARSLYGNQRRVYDQTADVYRDLAQRNGIDPANVVVPFALRQPAAPPGAPGAPGEGQAGATTPAGPPAPPSPREQQMLRDAREAVQRGANPDAVRQRLRERGIDPGLLR